MTIKRFFNFSIFILIRRTPKKKKKLKWEEKTARAENGGLKKMHHKNMVNLDQNPKRE